MKNKNEKKSTGLDKIAEDLLIENNFDVDKATIALKEKFLTDPQLREKYWDEIISWGALGFIMDASTEYDKGKN